jgi:ubiquitin carboxyl-terminal hydrolase 14
MMTVMLVREMFPQFGERNAQGRYSQQDADECYSAVMQALVSKLKDIPVTIKGSELTSRFEALFEGEMTTETRCAESDTIPVTVKSEVFRRMQCHIKIDTNHLHEGLKASLSNALEKNVAELGRSAQFLAKSAITRLPHYLTVQFVRFDWKKSNNQKAKILRKVIFPLVLDVYDFCGDELKAALKAERDAQARMNAYLS